MASSLTSNANPLMIDTDISSSGQVSITYKNAFPDDPVIWVRVVPEAWKRQTTFDQISGHPLQESGRFKRALMSARCMTL